MKNEELLERSIADLNPAWAAGRLGKVLEHVKPAKIALFIASLFLFIAAITLMKEGAGSLTPLIRDWLKVTNPANSMGFGWLFAYVIMSGSPVAASALAFFDAGAIDRLNAYTMLTGSRLGASFVVLFIGFLYVLRGRDKAAGLSIGLLSLSVTGTTNVFALIIGLFILQSGVLDPFRVGYGMLLNSVIDLIFDPIARFFTAFLPGWALFVVGLLIILLSFSLFDRCLPQMSIKESQMGRISRLVYRPWIMFILGALVTTVSMSVSVSLGILVPLSNRGFIRRENVIPYIMGANITTFIDTLLAAVLLKNPSAFTVVLTHMVSITIVSIVILLIAYYWYERVMLGLVTWVVENNLNLALFMCVIFVLPLVLILV